MYARTIEEKRRSILSAAGGLARDLPIGSREIGYYDRKTRKWSAPVKGRRLVEKALKRGK